MAVQIYGLLWISVFSIFKIQYTVPTWGLFCIWIYTYRQSETINTKVVFCMFSYQTILCSNLFTFFHRPLTRSVFSWTIFPLLLICFLLYIWLVFFFFCSAASWRSFLKISTFELVVKSSLWPQAVPLLLTEIPLQAKVFREDRILSGIDQVMCWAFVLFELGPLGRTMSYLLGPICPLWTWAFWQNCIFFICLGCSTEWWWSI